MPPNSARWGATITQTCLNTYPSHSKDGTEQYRSNVFHRSGGLVSRKTRTGEKGGKRSSGTDTILRARTCASKKDGREHCGPPLSPTHLPHSIGTRNTLVLAPPILSEPGSCRWDARTAAQRPTARRQSQRKCCF